MEGVLFRGIWLPPGENHLQSHLKVNPAWEGRATYQFNKLEAAVALCPHDRRRVALDVGAHVGLWSRVLAGIFGHVHAFEPVPLHAELWHRNVPAFNATMHPCALGPWRGAIRLHLDGQNTGATHANPSVPGGITAPMAALDDLALDDVDFIKIDCEGGEEGVIKGAQATLRRWRPVVIVEQKHNHAERAGYDPMGAVALLKDMGWQVAQEIAGDYIMTPPVA